jgi:hypothetical protein
MGSYGNVDMKEIKYFKTENIVEDTFIMYGMCAILKDNGIEFELIRQRSGYLLRYDDFDNLIYIEAEESELNNFNGTMTLSNMIANIKKMNKWMLSNIGNIVSYLNNDKNIKVKYDDIIGLGNNFYGYSYGKYEKGEEFKKHLASYGYFRHASVIDNEKFDYDILLIPKINSVIYDIVNLRNKITTKEGETIETKMFFKEHTEIEIKAIIYLSSLLKLQRNYEDYESVYIMGNFKASAKKSKDMFEIIKLNNWSIKLCEFFYNIIRFKDKKNNVMIPDITAKFVMNSSITNLNSLIQCYAKEIYKKSDKQQLINIELMEEITNMYSEKVKKIYNNNSVKEISKRLKNLLQHKEGYEILTSLYGVANEMKMSKILSQINDEYDRRKSKNDLKKKYYYGNISNEQFEELISLLNDKMDSKIMANAIIGYSKVFFISKNDKNIDNENNEEIIESEEV